MDEFSALDVVAVRAVEIADGTRTLWSDDDRAWASRAAAAVVGAEANPEAFLARRATLAVERLAQRHPALPRTVRMLRWRPWVGRVVAGMALVLGVFIDQVDHAQRINILAPPVLGLLVWNLAVYLTIVVGYVIRYGSDATPGALRGAVNRIAGGLARPRLVGALRHAIPAISIDWAQRSAPLYAVRAARILHVGAALLACGVIAGLYVRGLALEYQATWESTFLDAPQVRAIVAFAYAAGAYLTGIAIPAVDAVAAIRLPSGENAARWVHLMAATVAAIVIAPRLLLAIAARVVERHRAAHFPLPLDEPYFQRLLRSYRGGVARVRVLPYSYTPGVAATAGLEAIVARGFGGSAAMLVAPPILYGAEDALAGVGPVSAGTTLVALFNASATPEHEVHGAFLAALASERSGADRLLALIDESAWADRWRREPERLHNRRAAWRAIGEEARVPMVFVDLSSPNLASAEQALDEALAGGAG